MTAAIDPLPPGSVEDAASPATVETDLPGDQSPGASTGGPEAESAQAGVVPGELDAQQSQRKLRPENQDFMRVLRQYGTLPQVFINQMSVANDLVMGAGRAPSASEIYPPPGRDSIEVQVWELDKIRTVYQRHAAYPQALRVLREQRCVVLRGTLHVGKRAAAIRLAQELRGDQVTIRELSAEDDLLSQVQTFTLRPQTVCLVDGLLLTLGQALKPLAARQILDLLARHDSHLIICARPEVPFPADLRVVTLEMLTVPAAVLVETHLTYYGPFDEEQIETALAHPQVAVALQPGLLPEQADLLARLLAEAFRTGAPLEQALSSFTSVAEVNVREWFDETADDIEESAFRIALAVFDGATYAAVNDAGQDLARRLQPPPQPLPKDAPPAPVASPFKKTRRSDRLQRARARLVARPASTEYADNTTIEVVELEDAGYSTALLKYLWTELDDLRPTLLAWLSDYAINARPRELRLRAAGAAGALGALEFNTIRERLFRPWALSESADSDQRRHQFQAVGNALGILIWNDARAEDVLGLLRAWVIDLGRPVLKWVAARSYAQVGLRYPREAINQWRRILESETSVVLRLTDTLRLSIPHPLHMSVFDAIVSLFLRAVEFPHRLRPIYEQALEGLSAWVDADFRERDSEHLGLPLFLVLTAIGMPADNGSGDPEQWPPAMLHIIGTQPDATYRRLLAGLWRRALKDAVLSAHAAAALHHWVECAGRDDWLEETLLEMLREMLAAPDCSERERNRLYVYLSRWASAPKSPLEAADRLLHALDL